MDNSIAYRRDIDGLRAIAVMLVVLFHTGSQLVPGGYIGVDVFFVISGYLITGIILNGMRNNSFSFSVFYERRLRRIYPTLLVVLIITTAIGWYIIMPQDFRWYGRTLVWTSLSAANFVFMTKQGYFSQDDTTRPLLHTWSLGVEEQFYIILPFIIYILYKTERNITKYVFILTIISFISSCAAGVLNWHGAYFMLPTRFWELGAGSIISLYTPRIEGSFSRSATGIIGFFFIMSSAAFFDSNTPFPAWNALLPVVGTCLLVVSKNSTPSKILSIPFFVWIGRRSYAIYLWHWPIYTIIQATGYVSSEALVGVITICSSTMLAAVGRPLFEEPIRKRRLLTTRFQIWAVALVTVLMLVILGIALVVGRGFPQRLSAAAQEIVTITDNEPPKILKSCPKGLGIGGKVCVIGDESAPKLSVALVGDSHSEYVADALSTVAQKAGIRGVYLGKEACEFGGTNISDECTRHNNWVQERINELNPDFVIIVNQWGRFLSFMENNASLAEIGKQLGNRLQSMRTEKILLVSTTPIFPFDVPKQLARAAQLGLPSPPNLSYQAYISQNEREDTLFKEIISWNPNVRIVKSEDGFCDKINCYYGIKGDILFVDHNHYSYVGAKRLADVIFNALKQDQPSE